ncbi:MAG: type IV secretion system protein VirJ [Novosphingobium sp.]|nr:type IV secretion system protein VirJ [Novosphingobium sp.]
MRVTVVRSSAVRVAAFARRRWLALVGGLAVTVVVAVVALYAAAGFFDRDPVHLFGLDGKKQPVAVVYFSGDMGLRFGMGPFVAGALAARGVPVVGLASSTAFRSHRTHAQVGAIVAATLRDALARTGADRLVVIGQSFGADMARVGLPMLPEDLRRRIAAVELVVPGETAYFRADPSGIAYTGTPDAGPDGARALTWLPLTCIRGAEEPDSLCPLLTMPNVRRVVMPGDHFLNHDHDTLTRRIMADLRPFVPALQENDR